MLCLKILDKNEKTIVVERGKAEINLVCTREYEEGDKILLEVSEKSQYLWIQLDDALGKSLNYVTGNVRYDIPFGEKRLNLSPKVFSGGHHLLSVRQAEEYEIKAYCNLARNVNDRHGDVHCYPHASANVETRGESVFAAKNAIDGVTANKSHGNWPYASWGINQQEDAAMKIDFGRMVAVDKIRIYTRADFPHDNWWKQVTFTCSDGSKIELKMQKSELPHEISFDEKNVTWIEIGHLIKGEDPSPFPALTQIEIYGHN